MPACGLRPDAMANAIASGSATRPTVMPAIMSRVSIDREYCRSASSDAGVQDDGMVTRALLLRAPIVRAGKLRGERGNCSMRAGSPSMLRTRRDTIDGGGLHGHGRKHERDSVARRHG